MPYEVPVHRILARVPERARLAYTTLITHPASKFDPLTGCSCAYITQDALAVEMGCSLRTVKRAVADLQELGVAKVLAWAGATTEVVVRVTDVRVDSVFGPMQAFLASLPPEQLDTFAVQLLRDQWAEFDAELLRGRSDD
ncbi:hypothetical protein ACIGXM_14220 [Kitasatospora sp. NPDC052896]|uniref:hypothetical protein n=1 Tax=Kitasatospora sp. NPDC052896 TaxID=3364061 RepID=UPI0037C78128